MVARKQRDVFGAIAGLLAQFTSSSVSGTLATVDASARKIERGSSNRWSELFDEYYLVSSCDGNDSNDASTDYDCMIVDTSVGRPE